MDETDSNGSDGLSRRSLLRRGTLVAPLGAVGLPALAGPVAATAECPRSPGYWKTHWREHFGDEVEIPPAGTLSKAEVQAILRAPLAAMPSPSWPNTTSQHTSTS